MLTDQNSVNLVFLLAVILVPIIPGYIFFKSFPSSSEVQGIWKDWRIKLTGAFGGYFVLFFILFETLKPKITPPPSSAPQLWKLEGEFSADSQISDDNRIDFYSDKITGSSRPQKRFHIEFYKYDQEDFPNVILQPQPESDYAPVPIYLDKATQNIPHDYQISPSNENRVISVTGVKIFKHEASPPPSITNR